MTIFTVISTKLTIFYRKLTMSLVAHYGESSSSEDEDQLGDKRQDVRRLLAVLPVKGRNQAVRLGLPKYQTRKVS